MERDFKYEVPGVIFFVFLFTPLLLVGNAKILQRLLYMGEESAILISLLALGATLITSKGIGFLFVSLVYGIFNFRGGYSSWFNDSDKMKIIEQSDDYSLETLFVFRYWNEQLTKDSILDSWVTRRWTMFFTNWASIASIALATTISFLIIHNLKCIEMRWSFICVWFVMVLIVCTMLIKNSYCAKKETLQILDMIIEKKQKDQNNKSPREDDNKSCIKKKKP